MFFLQKTFDTEKLVHTDCTQRFLQTDFFARRNFTQSSFYTAESFSHRNLYAQKKYAQQFLQTDGFYTQKVLRTEVLRTEGFTHDIFFYIQTLYTQMSLHRHKLHTETCAHSTRLHTTNFYTERLCFPFLFVFRLVCSVQVKMATRAPWIATRTPLPMLSLASCSSAGSPWCCTRWNWRRPPSALGDDKGFMTKGPQGLRRCRLMSTKIGIACGGVTFGDAVPMFHMTWPQSDRGAGEVKRWKGRGGGLKWQGSGALSLLSEYGPGWVRSACPGDQVMGDMGRGTRKPGNLKI